MVNGENIIYHYIQKTLLSEEENKDFNKQLIERLIIDLSIWIPKEVYTQFPIFLPYVVRDTSCRRKQVETGKDEWGFANSEGFFRDDNSLIKSLINTLTINGQRVKEYNNKKIGRGFVASHIWRELQEEKKLASNFYLTNSFIPNLVWLPKQISKLTDREGSYAQKVLKTLSYKIYFEGKKQTDLQNRIWKYLDNPEISIGYPFNISQLNYFKVSNDWISRKKDTLKDEIERIIDSLKSGIPVQKKVKCSSYLLTLTERIDMNKKDTFINWLENYIREIG